jgi:membrane protein YqaA with SNARE-associated domain
MDGFPGWLVGAEGGLWSVGAAAFLAASVLPFPSEAALAAYVMAHPGGMGAALLVATAANTAGGMTTWAVGRWLATRIRAASPGEQAARERMARHGAPALVMAWVPLLGDALVLAAGWLKLAALPCMAWQAVGRFLRYAIVVHGVT